MTVILAVDPGAAHTGIVVVDGSSARLLAHTTIHKAECAAYRVTICDAIHQFLEDYSIGVVAVEDLTPPRGFRDGKRQPINPGSLIGTAAVLGVVEAVAWSQGLTVRLIPPGGNGAGAYAAYPNELVAASERRGVWKIRAAGKGALCHERSAWDVARRAAA